MLSFLALIDDDDALARFMSERLFSFYTLSSADFRALTDTLMRRSDCLPAFIFTVLPGRAARPPFALFEF